MDGTIELILKMKDEATAKLKGVEKDLGGLKNAVSSGMTALAGLGLGAVVKGWVDSAAEAARVGSQLDAVLKSTKGAAGVTKQEILGMANNLTKVTTVSDDTIISGQNMLLTFTKIGKDVFPRATETMLDMAVGMNGGVTPSAEQLKGTAIQLGKALNDPIAGATALRKVGVTLTEEQEKSIKTFMKHGEVAKAQKVILDELATEFGGSAKEATMNFAGQMEMLNNRVGEVGETLGNALIPVIEQVSGVIGNLLTWFENLDPSIQQAIGQFVAAGAAIMAFAGILGVIATLANPFTLLVAAVAGLFVAYQHNFLGIRDIINNVFGFIKGVYDQFAQTWVPVVTGAIDWLKKSFTDASNTIRETFGGVFGKEIGQWFQQNQGVIQKAIAVFAGVVIAILAVVAVCGVLGIALAGVGLAFGLLFSPLGLLAIAITAAILAWQSNFLGFRDFIQNTFLSIKQYFDELKLGLSILGSFFSVIFDQIALSVLSNVQNILSALALVPGPMQGTFKEGAESIKQTMDGLKENFDSNMQNLATAGQQYSEMTRSHVEERLSLMKDQADALTGEAKDKAIANWQAQVEAAKQKFGDIRTGSTEQLKMMSESGASTMGEFKQKLDTRMQEISTMMQSETGVTRKVLEQEYNRLKDTSVSLFGEMKNGVAGQAKTMSAEVGLGVQQLASTTKTSMTSMATTAIGQAAVMQVGVTSQAKTIPTNVNNSLSSAGAGASTWGSHLVTNFASGIRGAMGALSGAIGAIKAKISEIHQSYNPEMPAQQWGQHLLDNFANGMRDTQPKVFAQTEEVKRILKDKFGNDGEIMKILKDFNKDKSAGTQFQEIWDKIVEGAKKVDDAWNGLREDYQKLNQDAGESLDAMQKKHEETIKGITTKIDDLKNKLAELNAAYAGDIGGIDKSVGEKVIDQEKLITDLQKQVAEQQAAVDKAKSENTKGAEAAGVKGETFTPTDTSKDEAKLKSLQDQLSKEKGALGEFMKTAKGYDDEIAEARRRNELTSFQRFMEDTEARKLKLTMDYEAKKKQMEQEIVDLQNQKIQEVMIYEEKMAQYEKVKAAFKLMEDTFRMGLDAMASDAQVKVDIMKKKLQELQTIMAQMRSLANPSQPLFTGGTPAGVPKFAKGGVVNGPTLLQAGEAGPEAIVPLPDGRRIPVQLQGGEGGGRPVNFYFGDVNIAKEIDADEFIRKMEERLTRAVQLQQLGSL